MNPIVVAASMIEALERWFPAYTERHSSGTVAPQGSIGYVRAGWSEKPTFTPARCDFMVDLRISPRTGMDQVLEEFGVVISEARSQHPGFPIGWEVVAAEPGGVTAPSSWIVTSCIRAWESVEQSRYRPPTAKSGATDAAILRKRGIATVRVGMPRVTADLPVPDDFSRGMNTVDLDAMQRLVRVLVRCAIDTCTRTRDSVAD